MSKLFKLKRPGLFGQMVLLVLTVLILCILLIIISFSSIIDQMIERTTGQQALTVAELVAENDSIIDAFEAEHPAQLIQPIAEKLRERTGALYCNSERGWDRASFESAYQNSITESGPINP